MNIIKSVLQVLLGFAFASIIGIIIALGFSYIFGYVFSITDTKDDAWLVVIILIIGVLLYKALDFPKKSS